MKLSCNSTREQRLTAHRIKMVSKAALRDRIYNLVNTVHKQAWKVTREQRNELRQLGYARRA